MPTDRFYHLPEDKKQGISEAVINEFLRTSYGEIKISNIIREARISRGSIYTYFVNKEDMYWFAWAQTKGGVPDIKSMI